jgi:peptidoglycan/LPS O-acetylase OafA/YrhL
MEGMTRQRPSLSDPDYAAFAWRRYRRLMAWMTLVATIAVLAALAYLKYALGPLRWPIIIATSAGVGLSVLLGTALMGLVFLSSGTGHDQDVTEFEDER